MVLVQFTMKDEALMNEVIESLTVKETPDTTDVGVETITDKG